MQHTHPLEEIFTDHRSGGGIETVVRWCPTCGAIVIDIDVDGRTAPGRVMPMRFPHPRLNTEFARNVANSTIDEG